MPTERSAKQSIAVEQSSSERNHAHMPIRAAGAVKCLSGHGLDPNRNPAAATATCDLCRCMGTAYRCEAGCDYDACAACFSGAGSSGAGASTACCKNASTPPFQRGVCRRAYHYERTFLWSMSQSLLLILEMVRVRLALM
jgi:hypothetical protein